jgi:hypothetical protein
VTESPYEQPPQPPYPAAYPPQYPQAGYPPGGQPPFSAPGRPPAPRGLLWTWISFLGLGAAGVVLFVALAVQWVQGMSRIGVPENSSATYGTVVASRGTELQVSVDARTAVVRRSSTHAFNNTDHQTSTTHFRDSFTALVTGAPSSVPGTEVSFSFTTNPAQGTYLPVAPSRIKAAARVPVAMIVSLVVGVVLGLVGVVVLISWVVSLRRRRSAWTPTYPLSSAYPPPPAPWPPNP